MLGALQTVPPSAATRRVLHELVEGEGGGEDQPLQGPEWGWWLSCRPQWTSDVDCLFKVGVSVVQVGGGS